MKSLKIGPIKLKNQLLLAPMVKVTDLPFRLICRKAGAAMAYTEMLNIGAILHTNKKTQSLMQTNPQDKPLGIQITAPSLPYFKKAISYMKAYDLVDINCGCPSDRIMNNASGCILLKNPQKIASFIKVLKNENLTVTAKVRLGLKKNNVLEIAKAAEKAGADALTIHARLASQGYDVPADWTWIAKVKKEVGIPVIGNGDVNSGAKAKEMLEIADGAMIARAAIGNPLIFKQILHYLKTGKEHEPSFKDNLAAFKEYLELAERHSIIDISRIKYLGSNFIRDVKGAAKMRQDLMQKKSFNEIKEFAKLL